MSAALIPFTEETVAVQRPTFEKLADDLEAYQESLLMLRAAMTTLDEIENPTEETHEERAQLNGESMECERHIERLSEALVKKTDDLACVLRRLKSDSLFLKSEEERLRTRRKANEAALEGLKAYTQSTMERHGYKHLKTAKNTIALRGNGGVQPLVISQPDLIPDELCYMEGRIRADLWNTYCAAAVEYTCAGDMSFTRVPSNTLIREALIRPCAECDGTGGVDVQTEYTQDRALCRDCNGTGKGSVPGAHLEARGQSVVVR